MAVLIPPRADTSETWMSTKTLSAIGQFKGSGSRFSHRRALKRLLTLRVIAWDWQQMLDDKVFSVVVGGDWVRFFLV